MGENSKVKIGIIGVLLIVFLGGCVEDTQKIRVKTEQSHSYKTIEKSDKKIDNQEMKSEFDKYMQKREKIKDIERNK